MADILRLFGFVSVKQLAGLSAAWINLLQALSIDQVTASYAPISLLSARALGLQTQVSALPFELPPARHPCAKFRTTADPGNASADDAVISTVNTCFKGRLPPIKAVFEVFKAHQVRLMCWPELDCYGPRATQLYVGPQLELNTGLQVEWPDVPSAQVASAAPKRIFFYIRADHPRLAELRLAAQTSPHHWIGVIRGADAARIALWRAPNVQVYNESLKLGALLPKGDLVINQAGQGMVSAALTMGVPMLLLPMDMETSLTANQAQKLGSAIVLHDANLAQISLTIAKLLVESRWRKASATLATQFAAPPRRLQNPMTNTTVAQLGQLVTTASTQTDAFDSRKPNE